MSKTKGGSPPATKTPAPTPVQVYYPLAGCGLDSSEENRWKDHLPKTDAGKAICLQWNFWSSCPGCSMEHVAIRTKGDVDPIIRAKGIKWRGLATDQHGKSSPQITTPEEG